jgi:hypothetical protein
MSVSLRGALPPDDRDGLQIAARTLSIRANQADTVVLVIEAYLDRVVEKLHDPNDPMDHILRVGHAEVLVDDADRSFAMSLLRQRYESRTGKTVLPFGTLLEGSEPDQDDEN